MEEMIEDNLRYDVAIFHTRPAGSAAYGAGIDQSVSRLRNGNVGDVAIIDIDRGV
jgi:hypothetical protein